MSEDKPISIEDKLADAIAASWFALDQKAAADSDEETKKSEQTLLEWAAKLVEILKGDKNDPA